MKSILGNFKIKSSSKKSSFEFLSENEMLKVRGGGEPIKPKTKPKDDFFDDTVY